MIGQIDGWMDEWIDFCRFSGIAIALLHYDVTIKTFIKILLFNERHHGRLVGTKERKFTENRSKNRINSRREVE